MSALLVGEPTRARPRTTRRTVGFDGNIRATNGNLRERVAEMRGDKVALREVRAVARCGARNCRETCPERTCFRL